MIELKFYEPIKNLKLKGLSDISQGFGENQHPLYQQLGYQGHNGIDLVRKTGEPIFAAHDGAIIMTNEKGETGIYVRIMSGPALLNGREAMIETCYFHLKEFCVKNNQIIKGGQLIGWMNNTGMSTGTHLHFGIRPYWKLKVGGWQADINNGYGGYVDPYPYLLAAEKIMDRIIKSADENDPKRWLIKGEYRFWIIDPFTMEQGSGKIWNQEVEIDDPKKYRYGGAISISDTDDPIM